MTPETSYKNRCKAFFKKVAEKTALEYWATAIGMGAVSGMPDMWHQFGSVPIFLENKRHTKKPRKLQEHRLQVMRDSGFIAFDCDAMPESTGINGEERQKIIRAMLEQLEDNLVLERAERYVEDCYQLKLTLEALKK